MPTKVEAAPPQRVAAHPTPASELYTIVRGPVLGELGAETRTVEKPRCPICGGRVREEVTHLHAAFDYWDGRPLLCVGGRFVVIPALRDAIVKAGLKGVAFRDMTSSYSDYYEPEEGDRPLPAFVEMLPAAQLTAGSGWWVHGGTCAGCGRSIWSATIYTFNAVVAAHENAAIPQRTVKRASYDGHDFFLLDDPGPPLLSSRMLELLRAHGVEGLALQPAAFVD